MRYEEMKSIKAKLLKFIFGLALMVTIFGLNSITAYAGGGCRNCSCPSTWDCSVGSRCKDDCGGHRIIGHEKTPTRLVKAQDKTCTRDEIYNKYYDEWDICGLCPSNDNKHNKRDNVYDGQTITSYHCGCDFTDYWIDKNDSQHHKYCSHSVHNTGYDGPDEYNANHTPGGKYQRNNWRWWKDCTTWNCYHKYVDSGWNRGTVIFHFENNRTSSEGDEASESGRIQSPGRETNAGKTLVGWNKRSTDVKVYNVQKVPGASLATWNWDAGSYKSVREVVPGAQNDEDAYDNAAAVYEWNHVRIHYRAGYDTDGTGTGLTKDNLADYVDYTQDLDSRKIDQFTRTGYDIITKGWFTTKTNEGTYTHHVDAIGDAVCTDTPAYAFNKNYKASEWSIKVLTQHTTDVYIYPHWRAHVLHVNYNTNGGVDSTGKSGVIEGATWYYDDGKSGAPQKTYYVTNTVPTKAGYVFMGWGNKATWSQERYARQIANEATGIKVAYDNTQAKSVAKTAQDWASFLGKDLATGDQTVTFYAQWERVITYKFYYYNDEANKAYYYEGGYQDCNTASVAFHNDDDEYLYMDIYMKRCCEAAFSVQKDADSGFFLCKKLSRPSHYRWTIF